MNILEQILDIKQKEIEHMPPFANGIEPFHTLSLKDALTNQRLSIIAEIKIKSPSEGLILPNADPIQIAKDYESAGASAISVLTDQQFFGGHIDVLESIKNEVSIPILRKDFIIDPCQIIQSGFAKADAFLLIAEALDDRKIAELIAIGNKMNLDVLVEFHSDENAKIIGEIKPEIVGVNCRDLKTMNTDISYFSKIVNYLPRSSLKVAESGIKSPDDLKYVYDLGYDAVLVGTSLMKTGNPGKALDDLVGELA